MTLRNTVSGQAYEYPAEKAAKILAHPVWGSVHVEVRTPKPEVLSEPHTVENGERNPVKKEDK